MIDRALAVVLLLAGASFQSMTAHAEEAPADIVVLGRGLELPPGTPAFGSVTIDRARLAEDAAGTVEHALADVAGLQQFRRSDSRSANPSAQGVTLRALGGNATSRALVLLDGVPLADPFFGSVPFNALVPDAIGAVRVTRGGGAGAFGAGAVAGTIELFSADREQLSRWSGGLDYGSRHALQLGGAFTPDLGGGFVSIAGNYARGDGFWTTPANLRTVADVPARYRSWSATMRAVAPVGDGEVQARISLMDDHRTLRFAGADNGQSAQDASLRFVSRGDWQIDALGYVQLRNFNNIVVSASTFRPTLDQRNTPSTGLGGKFELRPPVGDGHLLRFGMDGRLASSDMYEETILANGAVGVRRQATGAQATGGLYVEDNWQLGRLVLTAGARADHWSIRNGRLTERNGTSNAVTLDARYADRNGWETSLRAGLVWQANDAFALRAAGYTAFRLPTINELYRSFTVFPVTTRANADLAPERLKGGEIGFDVQPLPGMQLSATAFCNRLENAIANVTIGTNTRQRRNVDAVLARGVEVTGSLALGQFDLAGSYAFNDSKVQASGAGIALDGRRPAQSPRHTASASLGWRAPADIRLSLTARYVGAQFEDDLEVDRMPGVATIDGFARVPLTQGFALVARVENLLDATVLTRKVGNSIDLGAPRTVWIGLHLGG